MWLERLKRLFPLPYLLILPATFYMAGIVAYPFIDTIRLSLTDANLAKEFNYIGFHNYMDLIFSPSLMKAYYRDLQSATPSGFWHFLGEYFPQMQQKAMEKIARYNQEGRHVSSLFGLTIKGLFNVKFWSIILRTFLWTFSSVFFKIVIGISGAMLLNTAVKGNRLFRVMILPPWIIPMTVGVFFWGWMYNGEFGMISHILQSLHLSDGPISFLARGSSAFWATALVDAWVGVPMVTLFFLAAIQSIPLDLYEAAWMDGASRFYRFRKITLPQVMPVVITMILLTTIFTFNSFDIIYVLTGGGPRGKTTTMIIDAYQTSFGAYKYGAGAARAIMICAILGSFCLCYVTVLKYINARKGVIK